MPTSISHFIDGKPYSSSSAGVGAVFDPATGVITGEVEFAGIAEVDRVLEVASNAFESWSSSSLATRVRVLFNFRERFVACRDELAACITAEHGKTLPDALGEVQRAVDVIDFACGIPQLLKGGFSENVSTAIDAYSIRQPLGVVVGITPFNFPAMVPAWMYPIAIACGNTVVLKPSEKAPSVSNLVAQLWIDAQLPAGVFNVLHGNHIAVERLITHDLTAAVSFVGSTPVARHVYELATASGKRVQALGGAKNHMVVLPDADIDQAVDAALSAAYGSAGERCMAISVVVVVGEIADPFVGRLAEGIATLRVGPGEASGIDIGPLITREHRDRVASYIRSGQDEGATLLVDGSELPAEIDRSGFFLGPTLFDHVSPTMNLYRDEIFGPVLAVVRVADLDSALELVNANPYGNGTCIFTNDGGAARRFQHEVNVGMVGINVPIPTPMAYYSFGGWKDSLFGDFHIHGSEGVRFYTKEKAITARWPTRREESKAGFGFPTAT